MNKSTFILISALFLVACERDMPIVEPIEFNPTFITLDVPNGFPVPSLPADNPLTNEGIELGKKLFHDPILSGNNTMACADCHFQNKAFSDPVPLSVGIEGVLGEFNASAIINPAWNTSNFWDGRAITLEDQALGPVTSFVELHSPSWEAVTKKLMKSPQYRDLFYRAFKTSEIDSSHVVKAIAQFERTLISADSKFDKFLRYEAILTPSELRGKEIFNTEKGDCFHCHSFPLFTSNDFHNNGLDTESDMHDGRFRISGDINDKGKFRSPTLRNIELTAPYMHDGRFATLEEVIDHYNFGGHNSSTIDPLMKKVGIGLGLNDQEKEDLINFLKTLTDSSFVNNPNFQP
ncbi:MAG: cytochrome c peroxidase [Bacteroidota bacterium]|nr:cytochrome c peroxidase [Bacteroidota bacterium]